MNNIKTVSVIFITIILAACSTFSSNNESNPPSPSPTAENPVASAGLVGVNVNQKTGEEENVVVNMAGGGSIATSSMNQSDKTQMSHALDAPLGKSIQWSNTETGYSYTVTPIQKLVIQQNPFCREYGVVTVKNGDREVQRGTACVMNDGNWHKVSAE